MQYNGISVGTIDALSLAPDDPRQVIAAVRLEADTPVKTDTRAKLSMHRPDRPAVHPAHRRQPERAALAAVDRDDRSR